MPRTPVELRPWKTRTSVSLKRMHLAAAVASNTSSASSQVATPISRSSPSSFMAILPLALTWTKSDKRLRRTWPLAVAKATNRSSQLSSSSGSGISVVMVSPSASGSRLTSALPRPVGEPSGSL